MKAAKLANSPRLQRVLFVLQKGTWHTTMDIIQRARVCAVNSCIAELRANGFTISTKRKGDTWSYKLEPTQ